MKMNFWLLCGALLAANLSAQPVTNAPPAGGAAPSVSDAASRTNAQAARKSPAKAKKAPVVKHPVLEVRTTPLKPGPATVVASNVNVRGQARLLGEVITRLTRGNQVMVLEEITLKNSGPEEPSAWAKIAMPQGVKVWVSALFVDPADKTVNVPRLNLRGGPGENYSVVGRVERGFKVQELEVKGDWIQIEAPEGAYAFMAAQYLSQDGEAPSTSVAATTPAIPEPAPSTPVEIPSPGTNSPANPVVEATPAAPVEEPAPTLTPVIEPNPIASTTTDAPVARQESPAPNTTAATPPQNQPAVTPEPAVSPSNNTGAEAQAEPEPEPEEAPTPRVVSREGVVRGSVSIQAPTHFELYSPESKRIVNYLYNASPDLDLSRYKGLRIIVTGQEGLDERWRNTPLITIQKIQVLE